MIFLVMVAWGPTRAFRVPLSVLIIAGLLALGTEALRRQTLQEFPDASLAGEGLRESWGRMRDSVSQRVSSARESRATPRAAPEDARLERLERLAALHERGVLSDAEFEAQKAKALES